MKYFAIFLLAVALSGTNQVFGQSETCNENPDQLCPLSIPEHFEGVIPGKEYLDTNCPEVTQFIDCIADYARTCPGFGEVGRTGLITLFDLQSLIHNVCNEESVFGRGTDQVFGQSAACDMRPHERCPLSIAPATTHFDGIIPGKEFLETHCAAFLQAIDCVADYITTCPELGEVDAVELMNVFDLQKLFHDTCDEDSAIGKVYRENVECINSLKDEVNEAIFDYRFDFDRFEGDLIREDLAYNKVAVGCLRYQLWENAVVSALKEKCGRGPEELVGMFLEPVKKRCESVEDVGHYAARFLQFKLENIGDELFEDEEEKKKKRK